MIESLINRRAQSLSSATRAEILTAILAALFFVAVIAWRFASEWDRLPQLAFLAALAWVAISVYWFRARIWPGGPQSDALAATGLDHYRRELERRRDHLRNPWLWFGPLFLASLTLFGIFAGQMNFRSFRGSLPLLALLALWAILNMVRRRQQAADLQRELDEISRG